MNYRNTQKDDVHVFFTLAHQRGGMGQQTIHLGIFKLTAAAVISVQYGYFSWIILKFLMRKLFHVLRQTLQITFFL